MTELRDLYIEKCTAHDVKPIPVVADLLATKADDLTSIDVNGNSVGNKGLVALLETIKTAPNLTSLNVSDNKLTSPSCKDIATHLQSHPKLHTLDISKNHLPLAGEYVLDLVTKSPVLRKINTEKTLIRPLHIKLIDHKLKSRSGDTEPLKISSSEANEMKGEGFPGFVGFAFGSDVIVDEDEESSVHSSEPKEEISDLDEEEEFARQAAMRMSQQTGKSGGRRGTVSSERISADDISNFKVTKVDKPENSRKWLIESLEVHNLFAHLEDNELALTVDAMTGESYGEASEILGVGEEGEQFIIIESGVAEERKESGELVRTLKRGDCLGETDVLYASPNPTSITVTKDIRCFSLPRTTYLTLLSKSSQEKRERYMGFLSKVSFLKNMSPPELMQLADALKSSTYQAEDVIIEHGSTGKWFHIIIEGDVKVIGRNSAGEKIEVCTFTVGECVGELEFINNHTCVADVLARTPICKTAKMNRRHFEKVMGPCVDLLKNIANTSEVFEYYRSTQK